MKEIPTLFSPPMAKATLEDRKTITRRVRGLELINESPDDFRYVTNSELNPDVPRVAKKYDDRVYYLFNLKWTNAKEFVCECPYKVGDILWGRETFYAYGYWCLLEGKWKFNDSTLQYGSYRYLGEEPHEINKNRNDGIGWYKRPSIFMPREACRIRRRVVSVGVERLHSITEEDSIREGIERVADYGSTGYRHYLRPDEALSDIDARWSFETLWQSINGEDSWNKNPWVWRIEFTPMDRP